MRARCRLSERGSATVLALPLLGVLALATVLLAFVAGAVVAQRRGRSAGPQGAHAGDGCAKAAAVTGRNEAEVVSCRVVGAQVWLTVRCETAALLGRALPMTARARAGPS